MVCKGVLSASSRCSLMYSLSLRTSNTTRGSCFCLKVSAVIELTLSYTLAVFFHASNPPFKYPRVLSKPTLESLVTASCSWPGSVINKSGCLTSAIKAPTHGAKPPSRPIKIALGIWPFAKASWCLTSSMIAPV